MHRRISITIVLLGIAAALGAADMEMQAIQTGGGSGDPSREPSPPAAEVAATVEADLDALVREALENSSELAALRHEVAAARYRVPQAGSLDDLMAGLAFVNFPVNSFSMDETPMTGIELRFAQKLPWPGKLGLGKDVEARGAEAAGEALEEASNRLVAGVKIAFYDLFFLDRSIRITGKNKALLQTFAQIAGEKYAVGNGVQADVTRAQVELSKVMDRLVLLESRREVARGRLNRLLNRLPQAPIETPEGLPHRRLGTGLDDLQAAAEESRPMLRKLDRLVEQAEARHALARKELRPDFTTSLAYRFRDQAFMDPADGQDFLSASIMVNVPLYARTKQKMKIAEAEETVQALRAKREDMKFQVYAAIQDMVESLKGDAREILLYETGILPQAEQSLMSSRAGYQVDQVDFLSLLNAQITLFNEEIEYCRLLTQYQKHLARLEAEVGMSLGQAGEETLS